MSRLLKTLALLSADNTLSSIGNVLPMLDNVLSTLNNAKVFIGAQFLNPHLFSGPQPSG